MKKFVQLGLILCAALLLAKPAWAGFPNDLSDVVFTEASQVKSWPVSASMSLSIANGLINMPYSATNSWPTVTIYGTGVNANAWGIVKENGVWKAGTWEWLRPGQTTKKLEAFRKGHFKSIGTVPLRNGDLYGFFVSGTARCCLTNTARRTNYVVYEWGKGVVFVEGQTTTPEPEPEPTPAVIPTAAINLLLQAEEEGGMTVEMPTAVLQLLLLQLDP